MQHAKLDFCNVTRRVVFSDSQETKQRNATVPDSERPGNTLSALTYCPQDGARFR
jgi:hypothetical protein